MSMITGCPACGTLFRVVPDQLKISEGWVRCGHCAEVFDARANLQPDFVEEAAAPPPPPPPAPPAEPEQAVVEPVPEPVTEALAEAALPVAPPEPAAVVDDGQGYSLDFVREDTPEPAPRPAAEPALPPAPSAGASAVPEAEPELEDVTFLRDARRKAFWRRPLVRALLLLVVLGLLAVLGLQVALHERDRLAAWQPQLRPLLQEACEPLGCTVQPPRRIDAIAIDSSGFTRLRPETYRLSFTLKNQSLLPVAMPALELTLTDTQDQPVLRRVLTPADLGAPGETLAAGSGWSTTVAIAVSANGSTSRIAGYRLLAFYP